MRNVEAKTGVLTTKWELEVRTDLYCELTLRLAYEVVPRDTLTGYGYSVKITDKRIINYSFYRLDGADIHDVDATEADRLIITTDPLSMLDDYDLEEEILERLT